MQLNKNLKMRFAFVEESTLAPRGTLLLLFEDVQLGDTKVRWCTDEEDAAFRNAAYQYE